MKIDYRHINNIKITMWKQKILKYSYKKIGIKRGNSYRKNEEISRWEAKINIRKLNWYFSTLIEVFLNQITVCSHTFILFWLKNDLCESQNLSIKIPCALLAKLCLSSGDLFIFSVRVSPFYSYVCTLYLVLFLPCCILHYHCN